MENKSILKLMLLWVGIIPLAILNGGLSEVILKPIMGSIALPISGILLSVMIFLLTYKFIHYLGRNDQITYIKIGLSGLLQLFF